MKREGGSTLTGRQVGPGRLGSLGAALTNCFAKYPCCSLSNKNKNKKTSRQYAFTERVNRHVCAHSQAGQLGQGVDEIGGNQRVGVFIIKERPEKKETSAAQVAAEEKKRKGEGSRIEPARHARMAQLCPLETVEHKVKVRESEQRLALTVF